MVSWFRNLFEWAWPASGSSLVPRASPLSISMPEGAAPPAPALPSVSRLYILHVDFPVSSEARQKIEENLDKLRERYGIDFFLLEPGIKLSRFDDI